MIERRHLLLCILDVGSNLGPASGLSFRSRFDVSRSLKEISKPLPQIADTFSKQILNEQTNKTRMPFEDHI
jgi:hypothetical protein